jgi:hypothetical protein
MKTTRYTLEIGHTKLLLPAHAKAADVVGLLGLMEEAQEIDTHYCPNLNPDGDSSLYYAKAAAPNIRVELTARAYLSQAEADELRIKDRQMDKPRATATAA